MSWFAGVVRLPWPVMKAFASVWVLLFLASAAPAPAAAAEERLPIFDAHMHYSESAWDVFSPGDILKMMSALSVSGALVSSTPDDGTQRLIEAAPDRMVGGFRPYRKTNDLGRWYEKAELVPYSEKRLAKGRHRVFGEVHLYGPENLQTPPMARFFAMMEEHGLILQPHAEAWVVQALFAKKPDLRILWAHAGFSEPAAVVGGMMDRYPNLWADLSYRAQDIMPGGEIDPEWRKVLVGHADRFMIGTDTWAVDRWHEYEGLIGEHRMWLAKLPPAVAEKIAHKNAEKLFGPGR